MNGMNDIGDQDGLEYAQWATPPPEQQSRQQVGAFSDPMSQDANGFAGSWQDAVARRDQARYEQGAGIVGDDSIGDVPMSLDDQRATRLALDEGNKIIRQQREEMSSELYPQNGEDSRSMYANYGAGGSGSQDWASIALRKQKQDSLEAALSRRQAEYDNVMKIRDDAKEKMNEMNQRKAIYSSAGLMSAYGSANGMSDPVFSQSFSDALQTDVCGFQILKGLKGDEASLNGSVAIVVPTYQNGKKTGTTVAGIMSPEMQLQTLQRAKLGDRTLPMQRELWGQLTQKYTPEQLEAKGLHNPDGPYVVGSTTLRGGTARRLAGSILGPERRGISAFGANGNGGFTQYRADDATDWDLQQTDTGTRRQPTLQERIASIQASGQRAKADADMRTKLMQAQMQQQGYRERNQTTLEAAKIKAGAVGTRTSSGGTGTGTSRGGVGTKEQWLKTMLEGGDKGSMLKILSRGKPIYETDKDGNVVKVKDVNGNEVPKQATNPTTGELMYEDASLEDMLNNIDTAWKRHKADAEKETTVISPVVQKTEQTAQDGVKRDANGNLPPSEYIKYRDANGKLVAGNGYIVGGKVYDGRGNLINGAMTDGSYAEKADADERMRLAQEQIAKNRAAKAAVKAAAEGGAQESPAPSPQASTAPSADGKAETVISDSDRAAIAKYRKDHPALRKAKDESILAIINKQPVDSKDGVKKPAPSKTAEAHSEYSEPATLFATKPGMQREWEYDKKTGKMVLVEKPINAKNTATDKDREAVSEAMRLKGMYGLSFDDLVKIVGDKNKR